MIIFSEWYSQAQTTHQQMIQFLQQSCSIARSNTTHSNGIPSIFQLPPDPATMTVATVDPQTMQPSTRNVFLKSFHVERGEFIFCTNFQSRKATEMLNNDGKIALNFYWNYVSNEQSKSIDNNKSSSHIVDEKLDSIEESDDAVKISSSFSSLSAQDHVSIALNGRSRQVRIEGIGSICSEEESDEFFNSRPLESRIASSVSKQSRVIERGRKQLLEEFEKAQQEGEQYAKRPSHWGGIRYVFVKV